MRFIPIALALFTLSSCATGDAAPPIGGDRPDGGSGSVRADARPGGGDDRIDAAPAVTDLDPALDVVGPGGEVCHTPGSTGECGAAQVCRFYDSGSGRCDGCGLCANQNDPCADSDECGLDFMCFQGRCTPFCTLGGSCGASVECLNIGHPTRGVCRPDP